MKQILIHGLGQDASSFDKTKAHLKYPDLVDCPNLTTIVNSNEYTYENIYNAFSNYCCQDNDPVNICGLSLGAVIALNYAVDNPQKVSSLILIVPQFKIPKTLLRLQNIIFRFMPNSAFKSTGFSKKDFIKLTKSMMNLNFEDRLKDINCPTLVLCGDLDRANKKASKKVANLIPNAKIKFVKDVGHEVNVEGAEKLAEEINEFFNCK